MTEWVDLTNQEKLKVLESTIDRTKVNKNSKFNKTFATPQYFSIDAREWVISAELYTREEALQKIRDYLATEDEERLQEITEMTPDMLSFDYVGMRYFEDTSCRCWCIRCVDPDKLTNFDRPVYYL